MVKQEKNLLPLMFFNKLKNLITGDTFPFYFYKQSLSPTDRKEHASHFMFVHNLFALPQGETSNWFETFEPILYFLNEKIKVKELLRMKLNLYTNQNKKITHGSHLDFADANKKTKKGSTTSGLYPFNLRHAKKGINIAILNFTTCNGATKIGEKIYSSNENEALIFSNELAHCGIVQTNTPTRIVLNIGWR